VCFFCFNFSLHLRHHSRGLSWCTDIHVYLKQFISSSILLCLFSSSYCFVLATWICIGILIRPAQFFAYAVGVFGAAYVCLRQHRSLSRTNLRFRVSLRSRCENFTSRAVRHIPYAIVKLLISREEKSFCKSHFVMLLSTNATAIECVSAVISIS